jgi:Flp pilus assembly protein TadD
MIKRIIVIVFVLIAVIACNEQKKGQTGYPGGPGVALSSEQIGMLENATREFPKSAQAWISLGNALMDSSRFGEAVDAYQKALAIDPKNVDVRVDRGTCLKNSGRPKQAIEEYRKALRLKPNHVNAHRNMGVVLTYDLHKPKEGAREFEKYLELSPNAPDAVEVRQLIEGAKSGH